MARVMNSMKCGYKINVATRRRIRKDLACHLRVWGGMFVGSTGRRAGFQPSVCVRCAGRNNTHAITSRTRRDYYGLVPETEVWFIWQCAECRLVVIDRFSELAPGAVSTASNYCRVVVTVQEGMP